MKVTVKDDVVRKNIELFKKLIETREQKERKQSLENLKTYAAFVHRVTGKISFTDLAEEGVKLKDKQWKPIRLRVRMSNAQSHKAEFEVIEEGAEENLFKYKDLEPLARQVMSETIKVLNSISGHLKNRLDVEGVLGELSHVNIESSLAHSKGDIIHQTWHEIDRAGAERLLKKEAPGTFFFRKDEYATVLEEQLSSRFRMPIRCWTLTYIDAHLKVSDRTIVHKNKRWLLYHDDPSLEGSSFTAVEELLHSLKDELRSPLKNH